MTELKLNNDGSTCCPEMLTFKVIDVMWAGVIFKGTQCASCGTKFYNLMDLENYKSISNNYPNKGRVDRR